MRRLWSLPRAAVAVAVLVAIGATWATSTPPVNVWNFFGYFTIQSNLLIAVVLVIGAVGVGTGRAVAPLLRGTATTYIALTGVVYNTLLTGVTGGVAVPWANTVLHTIVPAYAVIDWVVVSDRAPLARSRLWIVVPYPLVWLIVVIFRGATDGWVPYPFLDPATGYGSVALSCLLVTAVVLVLAALVWLASALHLRPGSAASREGVLRGTSRSSR